MNEADVRALEDRIEGDLHVDNLHKILYATDASVYREIPIGVVYPRNKKDIKKIVEFCSQKSIPLIPRAGGTSLAGQCVGNGLVVDVSKYMTNIVQVNVEAKRATIQPGVIRDELNHYLKPNKLILGPNTSTANRAMVGGMVGNNSCGTTSIVYGSMRDHIIRLEAVLSDGSEVTFETLSPPAFEAKCRLETLEGRIYRHLRNTLSQPDLQSAIRAEYPNASVTRRNTGYALDALLDSEIFTEKGRQINVCKLICGSEGTLALITEITVGLVDSPPPQEVLVALQFETISRSMDAVPSIMIQAPFACELMDKTILDCTKGQLMYEKDRFFLKGDPAAVLLVSFVGNSISEARLHVDRLVESLKAEEVQFEYSIVEQNVDRIWNLRKAGLGLLANLPGDKKAVACIEDTAVAIEDLREYIEEFDSMMQRHGQQSVYYAHAGGGEIHLRPILDLKKKADRKLFYDISRDSAALVKKYKGSLSGEHGDGRVRAPFIEMQYGARIYEEFRRLKEVFDPKGILNPGKIVDAKPMTADLRFDEDHNEREYSTAFDFSEVGGVLRAVEKCNGSGDCRKLPLSGGTMCPSYMATRNEKDTTRARANTLREILTRPVTDNAWNNKDLKSVMDLCISCKGCTSECPSNVDMSSLKAEFLYQFQKANGVSFRTQIFSKIEKINALAFKLRPISNFFIQNRWTSSIIKSFLGMHPKRSLPRINKRSLSSTYAALCRSYPGTGNGKKVYLFADEFTRYNDESVGKKGLLLLFELGYDVRLVEHMESGRAAISKGMLDHAIRCGEHNVSLFSSLVNEDEPLIGLEPSAILTFKDEYPRLVRKDMQEKARKLASHTYTVESFLYKEFEAGFLSADLFHDLEMSISLHGHCHQKSLTNLDEVAWLLSIPINYTVEIIPSGCCGMAGSFGYEKEHYDVSMKIGELVLFPAVRSAAESIVVASGTSCRHQIKDGTGVRAKHTVEVLYDALNKEKTYKF